MADFEINEELYTNKLKDFSLKCGKCGSDNVALNIDWAVYPEICWVTVGVFCGDCEEIDMIFET